VSKQITGATIRVAGLTKSFGHVYWKEQPNEPTKKKEVDDAKATKIDDCYFNGSFS
jgi:hypothetical protein